MNTSIKPLKPILTKTKTGKQIKRYDAKYIKKHGNNNKNINIGVTPQGTFYYREMTPDKSWGSLYMKKYDGTEVVVDFVELNSNKKCNVIVQKDGKVIDGKFVHQFADKVNSVTESAYIGYPAKAVIGNDIDIALSKLKERVDVTGLKPKKKSILSKVTKFFKNHIQ